MDSENCALLKEAAIDVFSENLKSVKASPGWAKVRESMALADELMDVIFINKKRPALADETDDEERDDKRMCVSTLRRKLKDKGLDVEGSREMLIRPLEQIQHGDGSGNSSN
jgi:hypothetical protein